MAVVTIGTNKILIFWKQFYEQMSSMQQIYFAGGESFIIEEHYEILEHAIKMGYAKILRIALQSKWCRMA